ncbi:MAG: hypothetical protein K2K57_01450, partial [Oscillospiraceae bacterium]|nr:hypothetical protein [Oscillospiraceae bacterium]
MKKKIFAMVTVVMFALGGCADSSVGKNEALMNEGASDSVGAVTANDEVQSMAESMAQSMFESMVESMEEGVTDVTAESTTAVTTKKETETTTAETTDKIQL